MKENLNIMIIKSTQEVLLELLLLILLIIALLLKGALHYCFLSCNLSSLRK